MFIIILRIGDFEHHFIHTGIVLNNIAFYGFYSYII
jgi:hypothetical protein